MREKMKKYLGFILAALMVFALTPMGAFAAEGDMKLTIKGDAGHTYEIYQLLVGDVSGLAENAEVTKESAETGVLANAQKGQSVPEGTEVAAIEKVLKGLPAGATEKQVKAAAFLTGETLGNAAWTLVSAGTPIRTVSFAAPDDGAAVVPETVELPQGYYLIKDSTQNIAVNDAASRFVVALVGDITVNPKKDVPTLDKKIVDTDANAPIDGDAAKVDTAAIGDTIQFQLNSAVPNMDGYEYYYYIVHDTLSAGLTLDADSIFVSVGKTSPRTEVSIADDGQSFTIEIEDLKASRYAAGTPIVITYSATVNENANIGATANTNKANLEYSNNPNDSSRYKPGPENEPNKVTGVTPDSTTYTYLTELALTKVTEEGAILPGVEFMLSGTNLNKVKLVAEGAYVEDPDGDWWKLTDGKYTQTAPTDETHNSYESTETKYSKNFVLSQAVGEGEAKNITAYVAEDGTMVFTGLNAGDYVLTETVTPKGYNTIEPIEFTISATVTANDNGENVVIQWACDNSAISLDSTNTFSTQVVNFGGLRLPSTGGIGTVIFYTVGGLLVIGAIVYLVKRRRTPSTK